MNNFHKEMSAFPPMTFQEYDEKIKNGEIPYGAVVQIVQTEEERMLALVERKLWNMKDEIELEMAEKIFMGIREAIGDEQSIRTDQ